MAKNHEIRVKVSFEELELLKRKAGELHLSVSTFLRLVALSARVKVESL